MKNEHLIELTATGIVTELRRASLLIPNEPVTEHGTKVSGGWLDDKSSYSDIVHKIKKPQ